MFGECKFQHSPFYFHLHRYEASRLGRVGDDDDIHLIDQYFLRIITFGWSHLILTENNSDYHMEAILADWA